MSEISTAAESTRLQAQRAASTHPLGRLGLWATIHRRAVVIGWLLLVAVAAPLAITLTGVLSGAGWDASGSESEAVRQELRSSFPDFPAEAAIVVVHQNDPISTNRTGFDAVLADLDSATSATVIFDPLAQPADAGFVSADGQTVLIPMSLVGTEDADLPESAGELIDYVNELDIPEGMTVNVTGEWPMWSDFNETNEQALHKAELLSGLPSLILLFLAFGSAIAAGLPLLLAVAGVAFGFGTLYLLGSAMPVSVWSMNFSMMIGLAVGIDYSLFIVSRYREERWNGKSADDAIETTMSTAGLAVLLSAISVIFSLAAIFIVPVNVFRSMAIGMILSISAVVVAALTLLPAVLHMLGDRVLTTRQSDRPRPAKIRLRDRWTEISLEHPKIALVAGGLLLGALIVPALGMRLGMPDARVVDAGRSSRDGYETLVAAFGAGAASPLYITVNSSEANQVLAAASERPEVVSTAIATAPNADGRVVVRVIPREGGSSTETMDLVSEMRGSLSSSAPSALVGGPASQNHDLTSVLTGRAPYAIGLIMIGAFLLLLVIFRSLMIALISVVLDLLSVAAAFGFATLVFQHGYGASLIGIDHQGFVDAWAPIFFFALLFGLSMDYQLFLLAAIREQYEHSENTILAVRDGIRRTGKPITNAAIIMMIVFIAFGVTGPIPPTELGITLAFAVLLDATIVRMVLVPAMLAMFGERTWWLPGWLERRLPHVNFKH